MQSNSPLGRPGAPGGTSGHRPDEKSWNIDHLGVILVPKMAFLGSGTDAISFKFGSDALKIKQFSIRTLAKFEFERDVFFFSGSAHVAAWPLPVRRPRLAGGLGVSGGTGRGFKS